MEEKHKNISNGGYLCEDEEVVCIRDTSSPNVHINPMILSSVDKLHENQPNFNGSSANVHINPNFLNCTATAGLHIQCVNLAEDTATTQDSNLQPHINPSFINRNKNTPSNVLDAEASAKGSIHINPNFVGRRLPSPPIPTTTCSRLSNLMEQGSILPSTNNKELSPKSRPHLNPKFVDALKTKAYDEAIKKVINEKDYIHMFKNADLQKFDLRLPTEKLASTDTNIANIYINPKFNKPIVSSEVSATMKYETLNKVTETPKNTVQAPIPSSMESLSAKCVAIHHREGKENSSTHSKKETMIMHSNKQKTPENTTQSTGKSVANVNKLNQKTIFKNIGKRKIVRMSGASPPSTNSKHLKKIINSQCSSHKIKNIPSLQTPVSEIIGKSKIYNTSSGSAFKKIGHRKLIRKVSPLLTASSSSTKLTSILPSLSPTKGSAQIYRVKTSKKIIKEPTTPVNSLKTATSIKKLAHKRFIFSTPMSIKFKGKKGSSVQRKNSFRISPLQTPRNNNTPTGIFSRKRRTPFSLVRNPFRIDRRKSTLKRRLSMTSINSQGSNTRPNHNIGVKDKRFKVNSKTVNKQITAVKLPSPKIPVSKSHGNVTSDAKNEHKALNPPLKPVRKMNNPSIDSSNIRVSGTLNIESQQETLINVHGVRYSVSENGRKLKRLPPKDIKVISSEQRDRYTLNRRVEKSSTETSKDKEQKTKSEIVGTAQSIPRKKFYLEGEEYVEDEPGILVRSRNSMTRASITNYKTRSIHTIIKSQTRAKQYCMFYNKFGKCNKKDKGVCPYMHDPDKVAVCRKFLHGNCYKETCLLSHKVAPEKMPSCKFFLEGLCTKGESCPYRHIKVNENAELCQHYQKGYCPNGSECKKKHEDSSKSKTGQTPQKYEQKESTKVPKCSKRVPPAKPQRKSLGPTSGFKETPNSVKIALRYYEGSGELKEADYDVHINNQYDILDTAVDNTKSEYETKNSTPDLGDNITSPKRQNQNILQSPNDSGPYEEIDEDATQINSNDDKSKDQSFPRPPLGKLPSYISLSNFDEDVNDHDAGDQQPANTLREQPIATHETGASVILSTEEHEERLI